MRCNRRFKLFDVRSIAIDGSKVDPVGLDVRLDIFGWYSTKALERGARCRTIEVCSNTLVVLRAIAYQTCQSKPGSSRESSPSSRMPRDCKMAPENGSGSGGCTRSCIADQAPADSPNSVTFVGSPPNFAMLSWTHCKASR